MSEAKRVGEEQFVFLWQVFRETRFYHATRLYSMFMQQGKPHYCTPFSKLRIRISTVPRFMMVRVVKDTFFLIVVDVSNLKESSLLQLTFQSKVFIKELD